MYSEVVLSFEGTHLAMAADKALAGAGLAFTMIPTPTAISAGCGISLRMDAALLGAAREVLARQTPAIAADVHGLDETGAYTKL